MRTIILCVLLLLPSCTFLRKAEETLDKANEVYGQVKEHIAKADTNQDGSLSTQEIITYLLGLFGLGGAGWAAKVRTDRAKHKAQTEELVAAVEALEAKVK